MPKSLKLLYDTNDKLIKLWRKNKIEQNENEQADFDIKLNKIFDKIERLWENNPENNFVIDQPETTLRNLMDVNNIKNKELFVASLLEEGGSNYINSSRNDKISGFQDFGLDRIWENVDEFITKGYLPKDFKNRLKPDKKMNERKEIVYSAQFKNLNDVIIAKKAYMDYGRDYVINIAKKKNIKLTPEMLDYFTISSYNYGINGTKRMMETYNKEGLLKDNSFLESEQKLYPQVHKNARRRLVIANMLKRELR